jgi:uncharacterized cupredoxin-like copper-binding protein
MNRTRSFLSATALALCFSAILPAGVMASNTSKTARSVVKTTTITVTAGKPSELGFKLSKFSAIPAGTVIFKVKNAGKIPHSFEICSKPSSGTANKCTGKTTPLLQPGKSATLTVKFTKTGKYEYLCTVPGHAGAGMKGLIGIGVTVAAPKPKAATTTTTTATSTTTTAGSTTTTPKSTTCASPVNTTLNVAMIDFAFTLSSGTIPCGTVTIIETNNGGTGHNFDIQGVSGADLPVINPGASATATATIAPGKYTYSCDVTGHVELGMIGSLTVTG